MSTSLNKVSFELVVVVVVVSHTNNYPDNTHWTGRGEAAQGGREMAKEGFEFDVVHTSMLQRAIKTMWGALTELNQVRVCVCVCGWLLSS